MAEVTAGYEDPISSRSRIIAAAARLTSADGWSKVTMGRLATEAGVSRQTVYNAVGSREDLAEAMVLTESAKFIFKIVEGFDSHPDDLLPLLTTHSESLLGTVKVVVQDRIDTYEIDLEPERIATVIDIGVRSALSHVMQPTATPSETAESITWLVASVLRRNEDSV